MYASQRFSTLLILLLLLLFHEQIHGDTRVLGAGASLPARLYRSLAYTYQFVSQTTVTYTSTGSGRGIRLIKGEELLDGHEIDFAASDAVLSDQDYAQVPDLQMYPSTATAIVPIYRLSELQSLVLSREALAAIFLGQVTMWNDVMIQQTNDFILPNKPITVVVRQDASGTTEIFTKALSSFSTQFAQEIGFSPLPNAWSSTFQTAQGTDGVVAAVLAQDASIGYAVLADAADRQVQYADMVNRAGATVTATSDSVQAALAELAGLILENPRLTADVHDASSSTAWPISGLTYFVLRKNYQPHDCQTRMATLDFIEWYLTSSTAARVQGQMGFARLPERMRNGVLSRMLDQVLCQNGEPAKTDVNRIEPVPVPVPTLATSIFQTFSAAFAGVDSSVEILPQPYTRGQVNAILSSPDFAAKAFETSSVDSYLNGGNNDPFVSTLFLAGVAILYRLDGLDASQRLVLSPDTLAQIYSGGIKQWNHYAIVNDNPDVFDSLPDQPIRVVSRSDDSTTTVVFTSVLRDRTNHIFPLESSLIVEDSYAVVSSDSQVEAAVLFADGAIGFVAAMDGEYNGGAGGNSVRAADTIGNNGWTRVSLGTESIRACLEDESAMAMQSAHVHTFDVDAVESPNCWPFALSFDVSISGEDVQQQCQSEQGGRSASLSFVSWLFDPETDISQPLDSLGLVPISEDRREAFHGQIYNDCQEKSENTTGRWIAIVGSVLGILLLVMVVVVGYQRRQVSAQRRLIDDLKKQSFAMRSVVRDWSPEGGMVSMAAGAGASHQDGRVCWYWKEDLARMNQHNPYRIKEPCWVKYDDAVSAQIEKHYLKYKRGKKGVLQEKEISCGPGVSYRIDVKNMHQTNVTTGYRRSIVRVEATDERASVKEAPTMEVLDPREISEVETVECESAWSGNEAESKMQKGGFDLPTDVERGEPFLILRVGAIIQTMKSNTDSKWSYGTVIVEPEEEPVESDTSMISRGSSRRSSRVGDESKLIVSNETGWFPQELTEEPSREALTRLVEQVGGTHASLSCPSHWTEVKDPLIAERIRLSRHDDEYRLVESRFRFTLGKWLNKKIEVQYIERIQNLAMYQSYSVKRQTLLHREVDSKYESSRYERQLFHGTSEDTIPKIIQQGFNRSFCGKNATRFGKGVYFAADSEYSASSSYSVPNCKGQHFLFVARVTVGEYCVGRENALTPDVRDAQTQQLYDSTVDNLQCPRVFVTYHDAQAYPEYLICFIKKKQ